MTAARPLSELARAEFEARLDVVRRRLPEAEAQALTVARPDYGLGSVASCWGQIAWWSRQLGRPRTEWQPAMERSVEWLIRRIEWLDAAGPPFRRTAADWRTALESAIHACNPDLEHRVLALPVDTADGSLGVLRPYADGLRALVAGDDTALASAAAELSGVPDGRLTRSWYPRLGPALQAILEHDAEALRRDLDAMCARHVILATKGGLRLSERAWLIHPVVDLLLLARRRGLETDVDPTYHALKLRIRVGYVTEWDGQPLGRDALVEAIVDPVPVDQLSGRERKREPADDPPGPGPARPPRPSRAAASPRLRLPRPPVPDVDEEVARESLRRREREGGSLWQLASWALMLGDPARARWYLEQTAIGVERAIRESIASPEAGGPPELRGFASHVDLREAFGLALVLGDERTLGEAARQLNDWERAILRLRPQQPIRIGVTAYLDLVRDLLTPLEERPGRPDDARLAEVARTLHSFYVDTWWTTLALVERNPERLTSGLERMLVEHARRLHLKTSPPPPVCEQAVHLAAAARRLGLPVRVEGPVRDYPVPLRIRNIPEYSGRLGVLRCDLLGEPLWAGGGVPPGRADAAGAGDHGFLRNLLRRTGVIH